MISGITGDLYHAQALQQAHQLRSAFQALGKDLRSGNLERAQDDFAKLIAAAPEPAQLSRLGTDLAAGDLGAAQQDYRSLHCGKSEAGTAPLAAVAEAAKAALAAYTGVGVGKLL